MAVTPNYGWAIPTVNADSNTWGDILNGTLGDIDADLSAAVPRGYLGGLTLSAAGATATFGVAAGQAADSTNAISMALASAYTKTTSSWAVGSGNGALDGGSIANSTWYHVYLIKRTDTNVVDVLVSASATSPTLPTSYTLFRRIGSMKTNGSAQWVKFLQIGDTFLWDVPVNDFATTMGTTAVLITVSTPFGIRTEGIFGLGISNAQGAGTYGFWNCPDQAATAAAVACMDVTYLSSGQAVGAVTKRVMTNTSSQIRGVQSSNTSAVGYCVTQGWVDRRGRDG